MRNMGHDVRNGSQNTRSHAAIGVAGRSTITDKFHNHPDEVAFVSALKCDAEDDSTWIADSGATRNMTHQRSILSNFVEVNDHGWSVKGIWSAILPVCGYGNVEFIVSVGGSTR